MKNTDLINLKATREFINDDDMDIKDKLQCLILEGRNIDAAKHDKNMPICEYQSIRLMFKQVFMEFFSQQDDWDEIDTTEGHFIHNLYDIGIYNITEIFCNVLCGISLQMWLTGIGGDIFNVDPEFIDAKFEYHNLTSGKKKISEFSDIYERKLKNLEMKESDVLCTEDIPNFEHKWMLDNRIITELDYFAYIFEAKLLFNPYNIQRVQLNGDNNDAIDILIFDQSINVVEIYRKYRSLHNPEAAMNGCFNMLHMLLYNAALKDYKNPLEELDLLSLGV